jgi:hypothetical protein
METVPDRTDYRFGVVEIVDVAYYEPRAWIKVAFRDHMGSHAVRFTFYSIRHTLGRL